VSRICNSATFAARSGSNMAKLKVPREICAILLNQVTGANKSDLDEIYDRYDYLSEKPQALAKWEDPLKSLLKRR
jgi:hypothetical protein